MKLYWRVKRDGRWTWVAAELAEDLDGNIEHICCIKPYVGDVE